MPVVSISMRLIRGCYQLFAAGGGEPARSIPPLSFGGVMPGRHCPRGKWRPGMPLPKLKSEMDRAVSLPGVANIWTQPIVNRIDMLTIGIRSEIGIKLFGSDLKGLEGKAREIADAVRTVRGPTVTYPEHVTGGLHLDI